jgi:hypothetical protein
MSKYTEEVMKVLAVFLAGIFAGIILMLFARPSHQVNAQANQMRIHVGEIPAGGETDMDGSQAVGFSCINGSGQVNKLGQSLQFRCFVATKE